MDACQFKPFPFACARMKARVRRTFFAEKFTIILKAVFWAKLHPEKPNDF